MSTPENPFSTPMSQGRDPAQVHLEKVRRVAKAQRLLNVAIIVYFMLIVLNVTSQIVERSNPGSILVLFLLLLMLCMVAFILFAVARMGYVMHGVFNAFFYSLAMLIPCAGLILLLILNSRVTQFLSRNGVKVGLMGAKKSTIP